MATNYQRAIPYAQAIPHAQAALNAAMVKAGCEPCVTLVPGVHQGSNHDNHGIAAYGPDARLVTRAIQWLAKWLPTAGIQASYDISIRVTHRPDRFGRVWVTASPPAGQAIPVGPYRALAVLASYKVAS
jgi:hypothetical protein